ncbi:MAG TPA: ABC transporter ATP-binding protein [Gaiellaceae bacterium]|jgi:peptide/nickel transport system ATP-binding protein
MSQPLLDVADLSVRFDTDDGVVYAVDRLSFSLGAGEVLGIVGESGCGKSVTCMSLVRLLPETAVIEGHARFEGRDLLAIPARELRRVRGREISYVFQEPMTSLNPVFTIGRQIGEVLRRHLGLSRADARARTLELLQLVRIPAPEQRLDDYPHQLSGGMRQRVMIAMALACDPKVLVADEPTTALDVTIQAGILDLMRDIRERLGTAIVLITHNLGVVADIADRVLVMYAGRKAEEASVDDLFAHPQHPYTIGLLGAIPRPYEGEDTRRRLQEIPGRVPSLRELPKACAFAERCQRATERCRTEIPELHEVRPAHRVACFHPGENAAV